MTRRTHGCWLACCALALLAAAAPVAAQPPATGLEAAAAMEKALVEVIAKAEKSVVAVARVRRVPRADRLTTEFRPNPFGASIGVKPPEPTDPDFLPNEFAAGVVVDPRGLVLTVYHVLGEESDYYVTTPDRKVYRARIVGADPRSDLAVLAPDEAFSARIGATEFVPIALGDAAAVRKGQIVVALGNPYAIARDGQASAAWGIVANLARKAPPIPEETDATGKGTIHHFGTLLQTDAKLNLGTSGGPLVNLKGEMVGLVTSIPAAPGFEQAAGYAIPVDALFRRVLETLKQGREVEYGFLGVQPANLAVAEVFGGLQGIRVTRVVAGTPAYRRGVKAGDLIARVNGAPIHDADGLVLEVGRLPVDSVVRLGVQRGERKLDLEVELMKYRVRGKKIVTRPAPDWRGMRVDYPGAVEDPQRAGPMVALPEAVAVTEVEKGTPAWEAGFRPGMLVSHVERTVVLTPKEFRAAVEGKNGPVRLRLAGGEEGAANERVVPAGG